MKKKENRGKLKKKVILEKKKVENSDFSTSLLLYV